MGFSLQREVPMNQEAMHRLGRFSFWLKIIRTAARYSNNLIGFEYRTACSRSLSIIGLFGAIEYIHQLVEYART